MIDVSIYGNQREQPSPLETMSKLIALKSMLGQQAQQVQEQELTQLKIAKHKQDVADEEATKKLFAETANPSESQIMSVLGPSGIPIITSMRAAAKAKLDYASSELTLLTNRNKLGGQILATAVDQPTYDAARKQLAQAIGQDLVDKHLPPQYAKPLVDRYVLSSLETEKQLAERRAQVEDQRKALEAAHNQRMWPSQETEAANKAITSRPNEKGFTPYEQAQIDDKARNKTDWEIAYEQTNPLLPPEVRAAEARKIHEQSKIRVANASRANTTVNLVPGVSAIPQTLTGAAYIEQLRKANPAYGNYIQGIVNGSVLPPTPRSRDKGEGRQTMMAVMQADPGWNDQRAQVRKAFTTGPDGRNVGALNTALVHLGRLADAGDALENGDFVPGNEAYNYARDLFGSAKVTNFELLKDAVAGEMAAALKGNATDVEIANMKKSIRGASSPRQMKGVVQEGMSILWDKSNTYMERFRQLSPDDTTWNPILPTAQKMLEKHRAGPYADHGGAGGGVPKVGDTFQGKKVLKVTRID